MYISLNVCGAGLSMVGQVSRGAQANGKYSRLALTERIHGQVGGRADGRADGRARGLQGLPPG
jgi:hypothetical protein